MLRANFSLRQANRALLYLQTLCVLSRLSIELNHERISPSIIVVQPMARLGVDPTLQIQDCHGSTIRRFRSEMIREERRPRQLSSARKRVDLKMERIPGFEPCGRKGHDSSRSPPPPEATIREPLDDLNRGSKDRSNGLEFMRPQFVSFPSQACIESSVKLRRAGRWERDANEDHAKITPSKTTAATPPRPNHSLCGREIATGGSAPMESRASFSSHAVISAREA